jgi:hypothetical protein
MSPKRVIQAMHLFYIVATTPLNSKWVTEGGLGWLGMGMKGLWSSQRMRPNVFLPTFAAVLSGRTYSAIRPKRLHWRKLLDEQVYF